MSLLSPSWPTPEEPWRALEKVGEVFFKRWHGPWALLRGSYRRKNNMRRPLSGNRALWDVLKASMTLDLIIEENNAKGLFSGRKQDHNVIKAACIGEMWEGREQHALRNNYFHAGSGLYNNMSVHYVMFLPPFSSPTVVMINHQIFYPPAPLLCPPSMGYKWIWWRPCPHTFKKLILRIKETK